MENSSPIRLEEVGEADGAGGVIGPQSDMWQLPRRVTRDPSRTRVTHIKNALP
jgi:hypothetical protein